MESEVQELLVPDHILPNFAALWPVRESLKVSDSDYHLYVIPLAEHLRRPTNEAWAWLLDVLSFIDLYRRLSGEDDAPSVPNQGLDALGNEDIAALLALCDFYDVPLQKALLEAVHARQYTVKPALPDDWTPRTPEEIAFRAEAA